MTDHFTTFEWKKNLTVNLTQDTLRDLYRVNCNKTEFDPIFIT